jgi:hypothetical protein
VAQKTSAKALSALVLCWRSRRGKKIRPVDALDIMNIIGAVVVAGNVRRSAQIALGDADDVEYLLAKRWDLGKHSVMESHVQQLRGV